jgi:hypothetical protein
MHRASLLFVAALLGVLSACSSSETTSSSDTGATNAGASNAKKAGDACTCTNSKGLSLASCGGTASGCFASNLLCQLPAPIAAGTTGTGTCIQQCTRVDEGMQGSCPAGTICKANAGGALICQ